MNRLIWLTLLAACESASSSSSSDLAGADFARAANDFAAATMDLARAAGDLAEGAPAVRIIGRVDDSDPTAQQFSWSGSSVVARFSGTAVSVHLDDNQDHFKVLIDGNAQADLIGSGDQTYPLASGLAAGTHDLVLYRQSEAFDGPTRFFALTFPGGGQLLAPPSPHAHKIELIGDSISCGYGDSGTPSMCGGAGGCSFSLDTEDHYQSYGALTARALDADLHSISWSGIGMFRNCCGAGGSTTTTMPAYYDFALPPPQDPPTAWDFSRYQPELVMINLGTNDYNAGDPGTAYNTAYLAFLQHLRAKYPSAWIMAMIGPMLDGSDLTGIHTRINDVLGQFNDPRASYFEFQPQDLNSVGCDCHPTLATHQAMSTALVAEIKKKLGW